VVLRVSVVYCTSEAAWTREVELADGATLRTAIEQSGVMAAYPSLQVAELAVGVFSRPRALDAPAREGDRIEIYRPLLLDPKDARRHRAELRRRRKEELKS
jgi:hypothetical protein